MTIPLDNLYDFYEGVSDSNLIIYRWLKHGSKKLEDLVQHSHRPAWGTDEFIKCWTNPAIIFHDQEPLDYNLYNQEFLVEWLEQHRPNISHSPALLFTMSQQNLRAAIAPNIYDRVLLVHSEWNGPNLEKYAQNGYLPVYVWAHALIAADWYRYAAYDRRLHIQPARLLFNIHARAWTGSREYRLRFLDRLAASALNQKSRVSVGPKDNHRQLRDYRIQDSRWLCDTDTLEHIYQPNNQTTSAASAGYSADEYEDTAVDVVLETMFESDRIHITEKTLRSIACRRPFILLSGPGSLAYLHHYGFKTFDGIWDESYDQISDPVHRLNAVINTMKSISQQSWSELQQKVESIVEYNQQRFFSREFEQQVVAEYTNNLAQALDHLDHKSPGQLWKKMFEIGSQDQLVGNWFNRVVDRYQLHSAQIKSVQTL
jgi:hypothetical protein